MIDSSSRRIDNRDTLPCYQAQTMRADKIAAAGQQLIERTGRPNTSPLDPKWLSRINDEEKAPYSAPGLRPSNGDVDVALVIMTRRVSEDIARGRPDPISQGAAMLGLSPSQMAPVVREACRCLLPPDQRWQGELPPTFGGKLTNGSVNPVTGTLYNPPLEPIYGKLNSESPTMQPVLPDKKKHGFWDTLKDILKIAIPIALIILMFTPAGGALLGALGGALGNIGGSLLGNLGRLGLPNLGNLLGRIGNIGLPNLGNLLGGIGRGGMPNFGLPGGIGNIGGGMPDLGNIGGGFPDLGNLPGLPGGGMPSLPGGMPGLPGSGGFPNLGGIGDGLFRGMPGLGDDLLSGGRLDIGKLLRSGASGAMFFSLLGELLKLLFGKHDKDRQDEDDVPRAPSLPVGGMPQMPGFPGGVQPPGWPIAGPGAGPIGSQPLPPGLGWGGHPPGCGGSEPMRPAPGPIYTIQGDDTRAVERPDKVENLPELMTVVMIANRAGGDKPLSFEEVGQLVDILGRRGIVPELDERNRWAFCYAPAGQSFSCQEMVAAIKRIPGSLIDQQPRQEVATA